MGIVHYRGRKAVQCTCMMISIDAMVIVLTGPLNTLRDLFYVPLLEVLFHCSSLATT